MKITAGQVTQERDIAADADFLNVPWQVEETQEDGTNKILLEGAQAFPLTASVEEVGEFLKRKMATYKENLALHEGAKELQAAIDNGNVVASQITGLEINE